MKKEKSCDKSKAVCRTSIGGQAVLEGVMMKGEHTIATAVRTEAGEITYETKRIKSPKERNIFFRLPFIRGVVNLVTQLGQGMGILMRSAEVYGDYAEPTKTEKWMAKKLKIDPMKVLMAISLIIGLVVAVALFVLLPNYLAGLLFSIPKLQGSHPIYYSLFEGAIMLIIFVSYVLIISAMKDIRRVFMYHGAEHRTINCYEHGLELTVENVQKQSTFHSRCGTTFTFFVIVVSIIIFAFVNWGLEALGWLVPSDQKAASIINALIKVPCKIVFIPVVAGISYEILKLLAKSDNIFFRILRSPGVALQMLTTRKPADDMAEVAIAAFKKVQEMDADLTIPTQNFNIRLPYAIARERLKDIAIYADDSDIDWLLVEVTGKKRTELEHIDMLTSDEFERAKAIAEKMKDGMPLQYALGYTEFYGIRLNLNQNVLIPRPETELVAEEVINSEGNKILDLCTGSGAIAIAIASKKEGAQVTASDVSTYALDIARSNASLLGLKIDFRNGNMFEGVKGEKYDIIVSNPPYIPSADIQKLEKKVKDFEPMLALDGGKDGLNFYRIIAKEYSNYLTDNGKLVLELGIDESEKVAALFEGKEVEIKKDYNGIDRILIVK